MQYFRFDHHVFELLLFSNAFPVSPLQQLCLLLVVKASLPFKAYPVNSPFKGNRIYIFAVMKSSPDVFFQF